MIQIDTVSQKNIDAWLQGAYDAETKAEIRRLQREDPKELIDAFYKTLSFGTGGLRGIMGVGSNRMNKYTVRAATQGLANYINKQPVQEKGFFVFIGYDSRHQSKFFAEEAAKILAGNGIHVYLCKDLRPTPLVSFGCRYKKCIAAIMITASHNPREYNGYKVYWSDGGQVLPPHDKNIISEVNKITDLSMVKEVNTLQTPFIQYVEKEIDDAYLKAVFPLQNYAEENKKYGSTLKVVYTSLHGTGITMMPETLRQWGFSNVIIVEEQREPDGDFPTVKTPNPEYAEALTLGINTLKKVEGDILIATDPDADRLAVAVRMGKEVQLLNGNQIACVLLDHICKALLAKKRLPERAAFVKTIGTTELFKSICEQYQRPCFNVLTGFKYIAEMIHKWETEPNGYQYIFGGEESYGYLYGTQTRDKDAILSGALVCEAALHAKREGKTLVDQLHDLYKKHGVFLESLLSIDFEDSKSGYEQMTAGMEKLRVNAPKEINGVPVVVVEDYLKSERREVRTGKLEKITLPKSDVLLFWLEDESKVMIRPSGTEPKVKLYCGLVNKQKVSVDKALAECESRAAKLLASLKTMFLK